jgi:hypothetical protein
MQVFDPFESLIALLSSLDGSVASMGITAATVPVPRPNASISILPTAATDVIIDVNGYFAQ